ncbi:hypothetical protein [Amycolatopsis sp. TRM77291]
MPSPDPTRRSPRTSAITCRSTAGRGRWTVEAHDGVVRVGDAYDNDTDRHVAKLLAEAVPGVVEAKVTYQEDEG